MANVVGTGINTPPAQLANTLTAITQKYIQDEIADNIFVPSPGLQWMTRNGRHFTGGELVYPLATVEELTGGAYYGDQILQTAVVDSIQPADQTWRFYYQSCSIPFTDLIINSGPEGIIKLTKGKWDMCTASFLMKQSRAMWHLSPQNTALDIDDGIAWLFSTTNVIAGIDRSQAANAFWLPGTVATVANAGALTADDLEQGYQTVTYGYDEPDLGLLPPAMFRALRKNYTSQIRYNQPDQDEEAVQLGFRYHLKYNNMVIFQDRFLSSVTSGTGPSGLLGFIINSRYMWPVFHPGNYFETSPFIRPTNQNVLVAQLTTTWQMSNVSPRMGCAIDKF